jgi:predicted RNase H-like HicB family nuclease
MIDRPCENAKPVLLMGTKKMKRQIWALVHTAKKGGKDVYGISFPDFSGVASGGTSMEDAIERGCATLAFHLAGLVEDDEEIPIPRSLDALKKDADVQDAIRNEGAIVVQVSVDLPGKPVRVNISVEDSLLSAIDRAAQSAGQTRSGFIAEAAMERLKGAA